MGRGAARSCVQLLIGLAFAAPIYALSAPDARTRAAFALVFRLGMIPMFLFSGAFFPIANLGPVDGGAGQAHAAVARRRPDPDARARHGRLALAGRPRRLPRRRSRPVGWFWAVRRPHEAAGRADGVVTSALGRRRARPARAPARPPGCWSSATTSPTGRPGRIFVTGFLEPVFYLFSIGIGVGQLVDRLRVQRPDDPVRRVRRARHARRLRDERLAARLDVQLLLQAEVQQALRPDAGHAADHHPTSPAASSAWSLLRGGIYSAVFLRGDGRDGAGALVVGGARGPGGAADRARLRRASAWR